MIFTTAPQNHATPWQRCRGHDRFFKKAFTVTEVDLSPGMLERASAANSEIEYIRGDMRTIRLKQQLDVMTIPDSIDCKATIKDLEMAVDTATNHLKFGGVMLLVGKTREIFRNNNFAYAGDKQGIHVTLLGNNHFYPSKPTSCEVVFFLTD